MLPADAPEARAAVTEAEALRQLLLRRQQISEAADWLDRQPRLGLDAFTRARSDMASPGRAGDFTALLRACLAALKLDLPADAYRLRVVPLWRLSDALSRFASCCRHCRWAVRSPPICQVFRPTARIGASSVASMPVEVY
jgi:hypothetical protein